MIKVIKRIIPKKVKTFLRPPTTLTSPVKAKPIKKSKDVLGGMIAYNEYGGYFTPLSSQHTPAVQKIFGAGVFEPDTVKFMRNNCGQGDIIHAGTFFGDFLPGLSNALSENAKIWGFEPNEESFRCAQITCLINNLKNVEIKNAGLGETKSRAIMLVENKSGKKLGGMSKIVTDSSLGKTNEIQIELIDDIIPEDRLVSIIQLDVEGHEKEALSGALNTIKRCKPLLILEDNNKIIETSWFADNIFRMGYAVTKKIHKNTLLTISSVHKIK